MPEPPAAVNEFEVVDVSLWQSAGDEQLGTKPKRWLRAPDDRLWLWKETTMNTSDAGEYRKGDDWAERVATEVARDLGVAVAETELAVKQGLSGTVSCSVLEAQSESLLHGNELLAEVGVRGDDPHDRTGYTVDAVRRALVAVDGCLVDQSAFECFVGYLVLDALVGNTDRHQENWAAIENADGQRRLAPSFDHASSLGFLLNDSDRLAKLSSDDQNQSPEAWAHRARTRFDGHPHPIAVAQAAQAVLRIDVTATWQRRLRRIDVGRIILRVPADRMSGPAREFALRVAEANRSRLLSYPTLTMDP